MTLMAKARERERKILADHKGNGDLILCYSEYENPTYNCLSVVIGKGTIICTEANSFNGREQ